MLFDVPSEGRKCGCPKLLNIDHENEGYVSIVGSGFGLDYPVRDLITGPDFGCIHYEAKQDG